MTAVVFETPGLIDVRAGEPPITIDVKPTVTVDGADDPIPF